MSEQAGDIVVKLSADQAKFDADLKQAKERLRNFGTQAAETDQQVSSLATRMEGAADYGKLLAMNLQETTSVLTGAAAGVIGFATGLAVYVSSAAEHGRELEEYSNKAAVSVERMQSLTYASEQFNVSGDKMADILKDTREKLGEYAATGGGGFKDFFDNVGKKIGLTVTDLQKLAGPDVLVAVKKAMDDANVSAQEQTFYMEGIASDLSVLNPLLENNGAKLKELEARYKGLNSALSATDIQNLKAMDQKFKDISITMQGAFAHAVAGSGKQIDWFTDKLANAVRYWGTLFDSWSDNPVTEDGLSKKLAEKREEVDGLKQQMAEVKGRYHSGEAMQPWDQVAVAALDAKIRVGETALNDLQKAYEKMRFGMHGGLPSDQPPPPDDGVPPSSGSWASSTKKPKEKNLNSVYSFRAETADIARELETRKELLKNSERAMQDIQSQSFDQRAADINERYGADIITEANRYSKAQSDLQKHFDDANKAAADNHELQLALQQERDTAFEQLAVDHSVRLQTIENQRTTAKTAYAKQSAETQMRFDKMVLEQGMNVASNSLSLIEQTAKEGSAIQKIAFLANKGIAMATTYINTEAAAAAAVAPPPIGVGLVQGAVYAGQIRAMGYASMALIGATAIAGMAHDGIDNIPREGTWLLDKNERVVDARTNSDLKDYLRTKRSATSPVVNLYEDATRAGQVTHRSLTEQDVIDIYVSNIQQGGAIASTQEYYYGSQRVGR